MSVDRALERGDLGLHFGDDELHEIVVLVPGGFRTNVKRRAQRGGMSRRNLC
jgi:hypothetical protein